MRSYAIFGSAILLLAAGPDWRSKSPADWTAEDAGQILSNSPWARTIRAPIRELETEDQRREGGNMGQPHGIGYDGIADDRPRVRVPTGITDIFKPESRTPVPTQSLTLRLRWETALPVRVAELKSEAVDTPTASNDGYALAVYGVPGRHFAGDPQNLGEPLRKLAALKREGKRDVAPSMVEAFQREDGLVIVYLFPLSAEITRNDGHIEFTAQIGRIGIDQSFDLADMEFQGRLEL